MLARLKQLVSPTFPPRLWYHRAKAVVAVQRFGHPAADMEVIGITGTNGKTTTTTLLAEMLAASGRTVAMATTIQFRIGEKVWTNETHKTTLSATQLQRFIRQARKAGCTDLVLEVSSHALLQGRTYGIPFRTAVFTNLTPEHLDYHHTMEEYGEAKQRLFRALRGAPGTLAVVNGLDPQAPAFSRHPSERRWVAVVGNAAVDANRFGPGAVVLRATNVETLPASTRFILQWQGNVLPVEMRLLGAFNVENAAVAAATALARGVAPETVKAVLERVALIPGRLEPVDAGQPYRAIVDYAVTPDSLEKLFDTVRAITTGRVIAVYGSCGDRDRGKRPVMGRVGGVKADVVVLTNEEPYTEDPEAIIFAIAEGVRTTSKIEGEDFFIIPDRRAAIDAAVRIAEPGDTIVLSGMGDQTSMVWGDRTIPWSDRDELRASIERRRA